MHFFNDDAMRVMMKVRYGIVKFFTLRSLLIFLGHHFALSE
jgi:hypothetical protein